MASINLDRYSWAFKGSRLLWSLIARGPGFYIASEQSERSGLHHQENRAIYDEAEFFHRGGSHLDVKLLSREYHQHSLAFAHVNSSNDSRQNVARGGAFRILRRDDNVIGADTNLEHRAGWLSDIRNQKLLAGLHPDFGSPGIHVRIHQTHGENILELLFGDFQDRMGGSERLLRNSLSDQLALLYHQHPIRQRQNFSQAMSYVNHRNLKFVTDAREVGQDFFLESNVERSQGLVRQKQLGLGQDRPGQRHSLCLSVRKFCDGSIQEIPDFQDIQHMVQADVFGLAERVASCSEENIIADR